MEGEARDDLGLKGADVLDIIGAVERRTMSDTNAMLTLLSSAISLVAIHRGIRRKDLVRGVERAFRIQEDRRRSRMS